MADVIITPASGLIDFQNTSGISSATIQLDGNGNLSITAAEGDIEIGNTASDIFVGDGVANVDIIFEEDGEIRGLTGKTITFGQSDSFIAFAGDVTGDVSFTNGLNVTGGNLGIGTDNPNVKLDVVGDANISGAVTATSFSGDGSNITGISTLNITNYGVGLGGGGGGGISNVVEDTTPQLGGDLDVNSNDITGTGNINLTGVITATSFVKDGGTSSQFLKADGSVDSSTYLTSYTETDPVVAAINGIVKSDGSTISAASAGTDYLAPTGDGSGLSGIVTNIQAGANITILESPTGNFIVTSTGGGGGSVGVSSDGTEITSDTSSLNFVGTGLTITDDGTTTNIYFPTTSRTITEYTATAGQTTFSGLTYTVGLTDVYLNGSKLDSTDFTATNGTSIVLTIGASVDDRIVVVSHDNTHIIQSNNAITKHSTEVTATGGQTVFNGTYTVGFVDVFLNGSKLDSSEFTATNGTSITLTTGATANDIIEIVGFKFINGSTNIELSNDGSPELAANLDLKGFDIVDSVGGGTINATVAGQLDELEVMLFT